jgi:SAM-dependent methyltransferase
VSVRVAASNLETAKGWDGPLGEFWTDNAERTDAQVGRYLPAFLDAAAITLGADVLDVGCGAGRTSLEAARLAGSGTVTGIDLSTRMLDLARRRAAADGLTNVRFEVADAQIADLGAARYDRIISRNGVMFFGDPVAAFANLARALRPGGRLVLQVWQPMSEQEWFSEFMAAVAEGGEPDLPPADGPGPFSLGDPDRVRAVLTAAGFAEPELRELREPMFYGENTAVAETMIRYIVERRMVDFDDAASTVVAEGLRRSIAAHLGPEGVTYRSAVWLVRAGLA